MKIKLLLYMIFSCLLVFSCAGKEEVIIEDEVIAIKLDDSKVQHHSHDDAFYPLKESMEDLQYQINILKAQVQEYESTLHAPSLNAELLKLIKAPKVEHEITMENGTIIQGKIINEDSNEMIVQTQIGQLKLDKTTIASIKNLDPLTPKIVFQESTIKEQINPSNLIFSGQLINEGGRRGDYIRVIYKLWETETKLVLADSVFISGNTISYNNNVISNSCLNPGEIGTFKLSINIPDSVKVAYWTKNITFNTFE